MKPRSVGGEALGDPSGQRFEATAHRGESTFGPFEPAPLLRSVTLRAMLLRFLAVVVVISLAQFPLHASPLDSGGESTVGGVDLRTVDFRTVDFRTTVRAARAKVFPAVVYIKCIRQGLESGRARGEEVSGSGVIISAAGEVLTNWHVVDRASEVRCLLSDGRSFRADIVASDRDLDLALIRLRLGPDDAPPPTAELGTSGSLEEGDFVMAMGAPWGLNRSVSVGIIACTRRFLPDQGEYSLWLQTDASISPGNSGGPLVDTDGRVIGINTLGNSGGGDLGFAVPVDTIREVLDRLRGGQVGWSWTGLRLQPLRDFDRDVNFEGDSGVIVAGVDPGSPAEAAGLRPRDRILSIDGTAVTARTSEDLPDIRRRLALTTPGASIPITLVRGDSETTTSLVPREKGAVQGDEVDCPRWGLTLKQINRFENAELYRLRNEGVFIFGIRSPGNAASAGLQVNDILLEVEGVAVTTLEEAKAAYTRSVEQLEQKKRVLVKLIRAGQQRQIVLDIARDFERQ